MHSCLVLIPQEKPKRLTKIKINNSLKSILTRVDGATRNAINQPLDFKTMLRELSKEYSGILKRNIMNMKNTLLGTGY